MSPEFFAEQQLSAITDIEAKRMRNLQAPISRVPPDVLLAIFMLIRDGTILHPADRDAPTSMSYNQHWHKFTQVCHTWRQVAVNAPTLWSRITASRQNHEFTLEMLRRSKQCPFSLNLVLDLNVNPWRLVLQPTNFLPPTKIVDDLKHHVGRCRALRLRAVTQHAFRELCAHCTSQLEYLVCDGSREGLILDDAVLPVNSLRHLDLESCILDWDAHFLNHLTHFKLNEIPNSNKLSGTKFIEFLLRMPALEDLHLEQSFLRDADEGGGLSETGSKIELKQLKQLYLICPIHEITYFLHAVTLPRFCKIRLGRLLEVDNTTAIHHLLRWVTTHFNPPHGLANANNDLPYFRSFCMNRHATGLTFYGFDDVLSHDTISTMCFNETAVFKLSLHWDDTTGHFTLGELLSLFPLSRIIYFGLYSDSARFILSSRIWSALRGATTLESVYLDSFYLDFFASLDADSFPTLSSVALRRASSDDLLHILDVLRWRTAPLQELLLPSDCIIPPHILPQLRRVVLHIGHLHNFPFHITALGF